MSTQIDSAQMGSNQQPSACPTDDLATRPRTETSMQKDG